MERINEKAWETLSQSGHIVSVQKPYFFSPHKYSSSYMESEDSRHLGGRAKPRRNIFSTLLLLLYRFSMPFS